MSYIFLYLNCTNLKILFQTRFNSVKQIEKIFNILFFAAQSKANAKMIILVSFVNNPYFCNIETMLMGEIRIDKWLWAVRIFKTRSQAAEACKKKRVYINGIEAKSSKIIVLEDIIEVKKTPVLYRYKVIGLLEKRVSAKLAVNYVQDITPEQEVIKLDLMRTNISGQRDRGAGRPTKKERRILDKWQDDEM